MTQYVINNDQTVKERIDNERNKVKDKADIIEGFYLYIMLSYSYCEANKCYLLLLMWVECEHYWCSQSVQYGVHKRPKLVKI